MKIKPILSYFWKLSLCGMAFVIGLALDGAILQFFGFLEPTIFSGANTNTIWLLFLPGSLLLALILSFVAQNLQANWLVRWIILFEMAWVFSVVGIGIASFIFISTGPVLAIVNSLFMLFIFLIPLLLFSATLAALFRTTKRLFQIGNAMSASTPLIVPVENLIRVQGKTGC
jgi:hypothetical protein